MTPRRRLALLLLAILPLALPATEIRPLPDATRAFAPVVDAASDEAALALHRMKLPPGLVARLWAAEPMLANPVAFNLDEQGRVFVAETHRYRTSVLDIRDIMWMLEDELANRDQDDFLATLRRHYGEAGLAELSRESELLRLLEDTDGDGVADKSTVYADDFRSPLDGIASGVIARRGEVWFTNIPSLWKFTGRDRAETRAEVFRGFGVRFNYTGHDFHGLVFGPDGRLYFSIGDRGAHVTTREGRVLAAPDTGSVFRMWPDGSGLELFATGLRNPQSLVFNEYGDLFTGDNDSDQGDEERLVHVVEGGDSGWRVGYQFAPRGRAGPWNEEKLWHPRHPGQPAYLVPPICNIEDGPSGLAYYPGTGLTPAYAGHLFITHFKGAYSNSGIFTYQLKPEGVSYAVAAAAPFLTGALPTDVRFGPDGRLYYSDWAEGWPKSRRGRIYTIADPTRAYDPLVRETRRLIAADFTREKTAELLPLLAHPDWRVRLEAQYTLAERGAASQPALAALAARADAPPLARRHALWALGQVAASGPSAAAPLGGLLKDPDAEIRAQAAKLVGDLGYGDLAPALLAALTDPAARVRFFAAQSLGKLRAPTAVPALLAAARANADSDAYLRHALVLGLAGCATPAELAAVAADASVAARRAALLALRRQEHAEIAVFLHDSDPLLVREAALAINDVPIAAALPALAELMSAPLADEPTLLRAVNAAFRLGTADHAATLGALARQADRPDRLRTEAVTLLSQWAEPPARDRNVGIYRPVAPAGRDTDAGLLVLTGLAAELLAAGTPAAVQEAALDAVVSLQLTALTPALHALVADSSQRPALRIAALRALETLADPGLMDAVDAAIASNAAELRLAALPLSTRFHPAGAPAVLARLATSANPAERRAAYTALGDLPDPAADELLLTGLQALAANQVPGGAQLELLEAAAKRSDPRVVAALAQREAALAADPDPLAPFRVTLEGGRAGHGGRLFRNNPILQCSRCHRVDDEAGGDAGPHLGGIGARDSRELLLEHILKPSARIAPGFQLVTVTTKDGRAVSGTLLAEDDTSVRLRISEVDETTIPRRAIASLESSPSGMPEVAALVLTKAEIRDLVAYLASLQKPYTPRERQPLRALRTAGPAGPASADGHGP